MGLTAGLWIVVALLAIIGLSVKYAQYEEDKQKKQHDQPETKNT